MTEATDTTRAAQDHAPGSTFSVGNRARRTLWHIVYVLFFRPSPRPMHAWRNMILKMFGAKVGKQVRIYPKVVIWAPWNLILDDYCSAGNDVNLYSMATIRLCERCIVSQGAHLCAGTHDYEDPQFKLYALPITIGQRSWVCTEAFVGPGVTVGEGAVLGARAVAMKDVPEWMVCAGNPCQPVKPRVVRAQ